MRGSFKNLNMSTQIGNYPSFMNYNFNIIENELNYYFDGSLGKLIKSVYVPNGRVDAYWGKFSNLETDHFTITGTNITFDKSFLETLTGHNNLNFRFSYEFTLNEKTSGISSYKDYLSGTTSDIDWETYYAHDDNLILSTHKNTLFFDRASNSMTGVTIRDELDLVESEISELIHHGNVKDASGDVDMGQAGGDFDDPVNTENNVLGTAFEEMNDFHSDNAYINTFDNEIDGYGYSPDIYKFTGNTLKNKVQNPNDIYDIVHGRKLFYIENKNGWVKIDRQCAYSINTSARGDIVGIIFDLSGNNDCFKIKLDNDRVIRINPEDSGMVCLKLIAVQVQPDIKWQLYSYSGNITIEKI